MLVNMIFLTAAML